MIPRQRAGIHVAVPGDGGICGRESRPERPVRPARERRAGGRLGPRTSERPARSAARGRPVGSAVGVARARGRRGPSAGPSSRTARAGRAPRSRSRCRAPSSSLSRRTTVGREQPQLGRPGGRVGADHQLAVGEATRGCSARRPRRRPARPSGAKTPCTRRSSSQPWSSTSRPTVASEQLRVAVVGVGAGDPAAARPRRGCAAACGAAWRASRRRSRGSSARARSRPSSCVLRLRPALARSGVLGPAVIAGSPPRRPRRTGTPASAAGTSAATAAVTSTCSAPATSSASWSRRSVSSSAKTSSRIRIGSSPSARSRSYDASRSASANDQDSPWEA